MGAKVIILAKSKFLKSLRHRALCKVCSILCAADTVCAASYVAMHRHSSPQSTSNRGTVVCLPYIAPGIIWKANLCPLLPVHSFCQCSVPGQEGTERVVRHMLLLGQRSVIMTLATVPAAICILQNVRPAHHWTTCNA